MFLLMYQFKQMSYIWFYDLTFTVKYLIESNCSNVYLVSAIITMFSFNSCSNISFQQLLQCSVSAIITMFSFSNCLNIQFQHDAEILSEQVSRQVFLLAKVRLHQLGLSQQRIPNSGFIKSQISFKLLVVDAKVSFHLFLKSL